MKTALLVGLVALAGCQANDATLYQLNTAQNLCAMNHGHPACLDIPRLTDQAHTEASSKTTALLLFPFLILEAVALAR